MVNSSSKPPFAIRKKPWPVLTRLPINYSLFTIYFLKGVYGKANCGKTGCGKTGLRDR